jgi:hypothetical protein
MRLLLIINEETELMPRLSASLHELVMISSVSSFADDSEKMILFIGSPN